MQPADRIDQMADAPLVAKVTIQPQATSPELGRAAALHLRGAEREASGELAALLLRSPNNSEALCSQARIQMGLCEFDAAAKSWERYHRLAEGNSETRSAMAQCLQQTGRWPEAESAFRVELEKDPASSQARLGLGLSLLHTQKREEAATILQQYLEKVQDDVAARFGLAVAYQMIGEFEEAAGLYEALVDEGSQQKEALGNLIALYRQQKDADRLMNCSVRLLALGEISPAALEGAAFASYLQGDYADSAHWCERLVQLEATRSDRWMNLALVRSKQGETEEAVRAYEQAIAIQDDLAEAHIQVVHLLADAGDANEAMHKAERGISSCPDTDELYNALAVLLEREKRNSESEEVCQVAVQRKPKNAEAWFRLGNLRLARNAAAEAKEAFRTCSALKPEWHEARLNLALAHNDADECKEARAELDTLLAAQPDWEPALRARAVVCLKSGAQDQALADHRRLIELGKADPEVYYNAGLLAESLMGPEAAAVFYREAVAQRPDFVCALVNLGHALEATGRDAEAKKAWADAMNVEPELAKEYFRVPA
ncbi:MAG TPA: tetratricopeptide repeat protein [Paludibaculum sp.]